MGGSLEIGLPKGGFSHLKILLRGGGFQKIHILSSCICNTYL